MDEIGNVFADSFIEKLEAMRDSEFVSYVSQMIDDDNAVSRYIALRLVDIALFLGAEEVMWEG